MSASSGGVRFFLALAGELRWRLAVSAIVAFAVAFMEGAGVILIIPLLGAIGLTVSDGPTQGIAAYIERTFAAVGVQPTLEAVLIVFLTVTATHAVLYRAYQVVNPTLEQRFGVALRARLYRAIMRADWTFLTRTRITDLVHALAHEVDRATTGAYQFFTFLTGCLVSAVYVGIAFRLSPALTTVVGVGGLALLWLLRRRTRHSGALGEAYRESTARQFEVVSESLSALKVTRSLGSERRNLELFDERARVRTDAYLDLLRSFARSKMTLDLASGFLVAVLLFTAVKLLDVRGTGLLMLIFVFSRVMPRVMTLQAALEMVSASLPSFLNVMRIIEDCERNAERPQTAGRFDLAGREVRLERISCQYDSGGPAILRDVSLSIPAGRTTAIVGASGAGKSTLADVLIGLLRPASGSVTVDGRALTDADSSAWRRAIGYVPQDGFLFHDTVRVNLSWGKPDATDEEMWRALERAAAAGFVRARPEGLDTVVGDRGVRLSGGERQRLALARALLTAPGMLVLDEATSALDAANERLILDVVRGLRGSVTTVIITHRLEAIRTADVIHVLEHGRLVESGTWSDLAARNGPFARLLYAQQAETPASI